MIRTALLALALALGGGAFHFGLLDGATAKAGGSYDPNGAAANSDAGTNLDPDGTAANSEAGGSADPNG
jgi:hypothetical protein